MTWYYLTSGLVCIFFSYGAVQFYSMHNVGKIRTDVSYFNFQSQNSEIVRNSSYFLILVSLVNLIMHLFWKKEIKKCLAKVIYRNEIQKEISLQYFIEPLRLEISQIPAEYLTKFDFKSEKPYEEKETSMEVISDIREAKVEVEVELEVEVERSEMCIYCCIQEPNISIDFCGHRVSCKNCVIQYLTIEDGTCPLCKVKNSKLYLIEINNETMEYCATAEINLKRDMMIE
jgi:hypothetical protein